MYYTYLLYSRGGKNKSKSNLTLASNDERDILGGGSIPSPIISMTTKHSNGSLNLWHLNVAEGSRFTQVNNMLNINLSVKCEVWCTACKLCKVHIMVFSLGDVSLVQLKRG